MTNKQGAPVALRLAEELEHDPGINRPSVVAELRRLHAENVALQQGYDAARMEIEVLRDRVQELGAMLRKNCNRRIAELEAQLEAIGAGGVEPLRRRECLHQISEPSQPESITDQEIDRIAESMPGGFDGFLKGWGWRQFARAVLEHQTREAPTKAAPNHEAQEPVAWRIDSEVVNGRYITFDEHPGHAYPNAQPLYTAPQPAPAAQGDAPTDAGPISRQWLTVVYRGVEAGDEVQQICTHPKVSAMSWSHAIHDRDAARSQQGGK